MAKKKDGITDLTKLSVIAAGKLTPSQFKLFQSTIFAMLMVFNSVTLKWDHNFLHDTNDIYAIHSKPQKSQQRPKKVIVEN